MGSIILIMDMAIFGRTDKQFSETASALARILRSFDRLSLLPFPVRIVLCCGKGMKFDDVLAKLPPQLSGRVFGSTEMIAETSLKHLFGGRIGRFQAEAEHFIRSYGLNADHCIGMTNSPANFLNEKSIRRVIADGCIDALVEKQICSRLNKLAGEINSKRVSVESQIKSGIRKRRGSVVRALEMFRNSAMEDTFSDVL